MFKNVLDRSRFVSIRTVGRCFNFLLFFSFYGIISDGHVVCGPIENNLNISLPFRDYPVRMFTILAAACEMHDDRAKE